MKLLKALLSSKKWLTAVLSIVSGFLIKLGYPEMTTEFLGVLLSPAVAYIIAQGVGGDRKDAQREAHAFQEKQEAKREAQYE